MKESEVKDLRLAVTKNRPGFGIQKPLSSSKLAIGSKTFSTGMTAVLYQSCVSNSCDTAEYLLKLYTKYYNVNELIAVNPDPYRPFPSNAICDRIAIVKTTLSHASVLGSSIPLVKLLLHYGASLNIPNCCKKVPIMVAIENQDLAMVNFLLANKVDLNCKDLDGLTPLMYIVREPSLCNLIQDIVLQGVDMSATDDRGYTALHIAIYEGAAEAVQILLQMNLLVGLEYCTVPHPSVLFDCKDTIYKKDVRSNLIVASLEKFCTSFTPQQQVDMVLVQAVLYLHDALIRHKEKNSMTFFEHKIVEAFVLKKELAVPHDSNSKEIQTYKEFQSKIMNIDEYTSKLIETVLQSMMILERCVGSGSKTLFDFAKTASIRMIEEEKYEYGMTLFQQMSDMLVHVTVTADHPSIQYLKQMTFGLLSKIKKILNSSLSAFAQNMKVAEINLISLQQGMGTRFTSILSNIVQSLCFCSSRAKQIHSHKITLKSSTLVLVELFEIINLIFKDQNQYGIDLNQIVIELTAKCPTTLVDFNGSPTTLLHLALSSSPSKQLIKTILENGGDYLINEVGPCGNRPIQTVFDEPTIQLLLDYGAHLDAVNMYGRRVFDSIKTFMSNETLPCSVKRLSCVCCSVIADTFPFYQSLSLPIRVKKQILLHDKMAASILTKEVVMFAQ